MMVAPLGAVSAESWVLFLIPSLDVPLGQLKGPAALASTPILFGFSNALSLAQWLSHWRVASGAASR
jgi:hypothetical protein